MLFIKILAYMPLVIVQRTTELIEGGH